jgi:hypothetical protein
MESLTAKSYGTDFNVIRSVEMGTEGGSGPPPAGGDPYVPLPADFRCRKHPDCFACPEPDCDWSPENDEENIMNGCLECSKKDCRFREAEWLPPAKGFCRRYILFLLDGYGWLNAGKYPPAPDGRTRGRSGTVKGPAMKNAILVKAQLDRRLAACGPADGKILLLECLLELPLSARSRDALEYISGKWPRETPYNVWRAVKRGRRGE